MVTLRTGYVKEGNLPSLFISRQWDLCVVGLRFLLNAYCMMTGMNVKIMLDLLKKSKKGMHILTLQLSPSHY